MVKSLFLNAVFGVVLTVVCFSTSKSKRCQRTPKNIHGCCDGYRWDDVSNNCVECNPGYTDTGCSIKCPYPLYGKDCQQICQCSTEYCYFVSGCLNSDRTSVHPVTAKNFTNHVYQTKFSYVVKKRTSPFPDTTKKNEGGNLEHGIRTLWQLMSILIGVLILIAFVYLGTCIFRHLTLRPLQVINAPTSERNNVTALNESHQTDCFYEQIPEIGHNDAQGYLTAARNDMLEKGIVPYQNITPEKIDTVTVSIGPNRSSCGISTDKTQPGENLSKNYTYENLPDNVVRETDDFYLTPSISM